MAQPEMILDYASPRKRSRFRLASASLLECEWSDGGGGLVVRERLAGQGGAAAAIVGALFMMAISVLSMRGEWRRSGPAVMVLLGAMFASELALIPLVIQQSWHETLLRIFNGALSLTMGGPLGRRRYAWPLNQIQAVRVIATQAVVGAPMLAEIEILADGSPPIRLFTDHPELDLASIGAAMDRAMKGEPPAVAAPAPENMTLDALRRIRG